MTFWRTATGRKPPTDINVVIAMPQGTGVKYEVDKDSGAIVVDRFLATPTACPAACGFIPGTRAGDDAPLDALLLVPAMVIPGAVVRARPIGLMRVADRTGSDVRVVCLPHGRIDPKTADLVDVWDLSEFTRMGVERFFERGHDPDGTRQLRVTGWEGHRAAEEAILHALLIPEPA